MNRPISYAMTDAAIPHPPTHLVDDLERGSLPSSRLIRASLLRTLRSESSRDLRRLIASEQRLALPPHGLKHGSAQADLFFWLFHNGLAG